MHECVRKLTFRQSNLKLAGAHVFHHTMFHLPETAVSTSTRLLAATLLACTAWSAIAADTPSPAVPSKPTVEERMAKARDAIKAKDWGTARNELTAAYRESPRNADVNNLLGYTYRKQATPDLSKAFEHYQNALRMNPQHRGAHEYIGEAYLMDNKPAEAQKHLAELEKICGNRTCEEYADLAKAIADPAARK